MLDLFNLPSKPSTTSQTFYVSQLDPTVISNISSVTIASTAGVLTVPAATYYVGQAIQITGTFSTGTITGYVTGNIYYIITVTSTTSITISATPGGTAVVSTTGTPTPGATFNIVTFPWQTWSKPRNATMAYIFCLAGGGGGGSGSSSTGGSGGGGGGGSTQSTLFIPTFLLPDTLHILVGGGGAGGVGVNGAGTSIAGLPGVVGERSIVSIYPDTTPNHTLLMANGGTAGLAGTTATLAAGTAAAAPSIVNMPLAGLGNVRLYSGHTGGAANDVNNTGAALTLPTSGLVVTGGSGGGATSGSTTGIAITAAGQIPAQAAAAAGAKGGNGYLIQSPKLPWFAIGGGGGGGGTTTAGAGGPGKYGSGGGGGGGTNATSLSAAGGDGGDGIVIIQTW